MNCAGSPRTWRSTAAAQIVDHHLVRHTQGVEGVDVRAEELLHGLRQGELDVQLPAVGQHHDEERQAPAGVADGDRAELAPVDLGHLAGGEGQGQKRLARARADGAHVILDDADAAVVAGLAQALEDLLGGQRMGIEPADDAALERIEFAGALNTRPAGHRGDRSSGARS